ncbi:neuritin [Clupea harengus]|uniref:Neuritin n=1 Tax=Clupea harengus TaxID=7950 RepID=A0A6P3VHK0_CLUHA|nr:neuritin [Clupea harengus]
MLGLGDNFSSQLFKIGIPYNGFTSRRMGLTLRGRYILLFLAVQIAYLLQAVRAAGKCETVFKGFSNCLLELGEHMANYPQELDEKENIQKICGFWDGFHSCATTALADCQEGATDLWEKLKKESRNLEFRGSLFELCGGANGASTSTIPFGLALLLTAFSTLVTWLTF